MIHAFFLAFSFLSIFVFFHRDRRKEAKRTDLVRGAGPKTGRASKPWPTVKGWGTQSSGGGDTWQCVQRTYEGLEWRDTG